jgi:hypothetical protein
LTEGEKPGRTFLFFSNLSVSNTPQHLPTRRLYPSPGFSFSGLVFPFLRGRLHGCLSTLSLIFALQGKTHGFFYRILSIEVAVDFESLCAIHFSYFFFFRVTTD